MCTHILREVIIAFFISFQCGVEFPKVILSQNLFNALIRNPPGRPHMEKNKNLHFFQYGNTVITEYLLFFLVEYLYSPIKTLPEKLSAFLTRASYISSSPLN